jgi:hypothetical protein
MFDFAGTDCFSFFCWCSEAGRQLFAGYGGGGTVGAACIGSAKATAALVDAAAGREALLARAGAYGMLEIVHNGLARNQVMSSCVARCGTPGCPFDCSARSTLEDLVSVLQSAKGLFLGGAAT